MKSTAVPVTSSHGATTENQVEFASIETAIRELRAGRMIVVVDDEDRAQIAGRDGPCASVSRIAAIAAAAVSGRAFS